MPLLKAYWWGLLDYLIQTVMVAHGYWVVGRIPHYNDFFIACAELPYGLYRLIVKLLQIPNGSITNTRLQNQTTRTTPYQKLVPFHAITPVGSPVFQGVAQKKRLPEMSLFEAASFFS